MLRANQTSEYIFKNNINYVFSSYDYFLILPSIITFLFGFFYLKNHKHFKIISNYIHLIHAIIVIVGYQFNQYEMIVNISTGFFIADIIKLIFIDRPSQKIPFLIHHFIGISVLYLVNQNFYNLKNLGMNIFYALEFSNIPMYINYLIIKTSNNKYLLLFVTFIQLLWYSYFRLFIFTVEIIQSKEMLLKANSFSVYSFTSIIFTMGVYWSCSLFVKISQLLYKISKLD